MNLSRFSVERPIFTTMIMLILLLMGGVALSRLPIDLMPDISYPTLTVITTYENASPEEIEEMITRPVEEAVSAVPGVEEVTSSSTEGTSNVRVSFSWGKDLDGAANDVRERIDRILSRLPDESDRPRLVKFDLASFPILILGAYSDLDPIQMQEIIDNQIKYRLERVPGVAALDVWGGQEREIHVNLLSDRIKALGLSLDEVMTGIKAANIKLPAGNIDRGNFEVTLRTLGEFQNLDELRNTVVVIKKGAPIQLKEIAEVQDSHKKITRIVRVNGVPGVRLAVRKQSGTNTVEVASQVLKELEKINQDLPQIHVVPIIDTSQYIQRSITNIGVSALYGGLLALVILLFFLRNISSTLVVTTAIPISLVSTFALIYFCGFTLNIMTLGGLALGVGMLVDNAIVVLENITRINEEGKEPFQASIEGSEEVAAAIVASTLTTLAVFFPLIFVRGMAGIMFKQLAYVVSFSLLCSLLVALTLVPMLSSKLLRVRRESSSSGEGGWLVQLSERAFLRFENGYRGLLEWSLEHKKTVVFLILFLMVGSGLLIPFIGSEFMPGSDEGEVRVYGEMDEGTRLDLMDKKFRLLEKIVKEEVPEVDKIVVSIGGSSWRGTASNTGNIRVSLKSQAERSRSSEEIANLLRKKLKNIPGVEIRTRPGQGLFILRMGSGEGEKITIDIRGYDLKVADGLANQVKAMVEKIPGVTDAQLSRKSGSPEEVIRVDRAKAADMGLSISQIASMLQTMVGGSPVSNYREGGEEYRILVKLKDVEHHSLKDLLDLTLTNSRGNPVVLRNVVSVLPRRGPVQITRKDQERVTSLAVNYTNRDLASVLKDIREGLRTIPLPRNFSLVFSGDYEEQQKSFRELVLGFLLSLILVYMVMACLYESLRDPFIVMFSVPLSAIGVILILLLSGTTFNVQTFIGCIMLGGIVVNNAILLVDHTNLLRHRENFSLKEAIAEAGRRRLRPILMTALTTILGLLPLAFGMGEGGEAQAPMARAVIGGLFTSTLISLVCIPVVYAFFHRGEVEPVQKTVDEATEDVL